MPASSVSWEMDLPAVSCEARPRWSARRSTCSRLASSHAEPRVVEKSKAASRSFRVYARRATPGSPPSSSESVMYTSANCPAHAARLGNQDSSTEMCTEPATGPAPCLPHARTHPACLPPVRHTASRLLTFLLAIRSRRRCGPRFAGGNKPDVARLQTAGLQARSWTKTARFSSRVDAEQVVSQVCCSGHVGQDFRCCREGYDGD